MYNQNFVLPQTGAVTLGAFGLSTSNSVAIGACLLISGIIIFKLIRFKVKEAKC